MVGPGVNGAAPPPVPVVPVFVPDVPDEPDDPDVPPDEPDDPDVPPDEPDVPEFPPAEKSIPFPNGGTGWPKVFGNPLPTLLWRLKLKSMPMRSKKLSCTVMNRHSI